MIFQPKQCDWSQPGRTGRLIEEKNKEHESHETSTDVLSVDSLWPMVKKALSDFSDILFFTHIGRKAFPYLSQELIDSQSASVCKCHRFNILRIFFHGNIFRLRGTKSNLLILYLTLFMMSILVRNYVITKKVL